jgi:hypothetical protein
MLKPILASYRQSGSFVPCVVEIDDAVRGAFVAFRRNPGSFSESIFDGEWSIPDRNPERGEIRLVAVVEGRDGLWVVGRQGNGIFAARG